METEYFSFLSSKITLTKSIKFVINYLVSTILTFNIMNMNLCDRLFQFSVRCLKYLRLFPDTFEYKVIKYQLAKSVTSAGANYEEAQAGSTRADFNYKALISLREMRETNYWLRILQSIQKEPVNDPELLLILNESKELKNILGAIVKKTKPASKIR